MSFDHDLVTQDKCAIKFEQCCDFHYTFSLGAVITPYWGFVDQEPNLRVNR